MSAAPAVAEPLTRAREARREPDDELSRSLQRIGALLSPSRSLGWQFDLPDLGDLTLPPVQGSAEDRARLRAVAALYFVAEIESTRLLACVDMLARLLVSGGLDAEPTDSGRGLIAWHRSREQRMATEEREALFGRLFGKPYGPDLAPGGTRNVGFESDMIEFASVLAEAVGNSAGGPLQPSDTARLRVAATALSADLLQGGGSIASLAAEETTAAVREAVSVLHDPGLQRWAGGTSIWDIVRRVARSYLQVDVDIASHAARAKSGLALLAWLADSLAALEGSGALETPPADLAGSALEWLQATNTLYQRAAAPRPAA